MGFWDDLFDSKLKLRNDINAQRANIEGTSAKVARLNEQVRSLEAELTKTKKNYQVMLEVLIEQDFLTKEAFSTRVKESKTTPEIQSGDWIKSRLNRQQQQR